MEEAIDRRGETHAGDAEKNSLNLPSFPPTAQQHPRSSSRLHAAARLGGAGAAAARSAAAASLALRQAFPSLYPPAPHALFELEETHLRSLPAQALCGVCFKPADVDIVSEASATAASKLLVPASK